MDMEKHFFKMHHRIKLKLDAICQEAGDMNVEEFMQVYNSFSDTEDEEGLSEDQSIANMDIDTPTKPIATSIDRNFQEDMINNMDMGQLD